MSQYEVPPEIESMLKGMNERQLREIEFHIYHMRMSLLGLKHSKLVKDNKP